MGSWISKEGVWTPKIERAILPDAPQGEEVYEGPDRSATETLEKEGVDHLGTHYSMDPEIIMRAKQMGFNNVKEYLEMYNYNPEKANEAFEENEKKLVDHKDPKRAEPVQTISGGTDTSGGGKSMKGGFGDRPEVK